MSSAAGRLKEKICAASSDAAARSIIGQTPTPVSDNLPAGRQVGHPGRRRLGSAGPVLSRCDRSGGTKPRFLEKCEKMGFTLPPEVYAAGTDE